MNDVNIICALSFGCPALIRQDDCPLKALDSLSFKEKVIMLGSLSSEEKEMILKHHTDCSKKRKFLDTKFSGSHETIAGQNKKPLGGAE